jgi:hypothetical protein
MHLVGYLYEDKIKFVSVDATELLPPYVYERSSLNTQIRRHKHAACQFIFYDPLAHPSQITASGPTWCQRSFLFKTILVTLLKVQKDLLSLNGIP